MASRADKVAGAVKGVGAKAYGIAKDPVLQAKAKKIFENGAKAYKAATSPEAREAYRHAAEVLKKVRKSRNQKCR